MPLEVETHTKVYTLYKWKYIQWKVLNYNFILIILNLLLTAIINYKQLLLIKLKSSLNKIKNCLVIKSN